MTGVIFIFVTPVISICYLGDYNIIPFSFILNAIGAKKE